jgi:hypothetical protein
VPLLGLDDGVDGQKTNGVGQGLLGVGAHVMSERLGFGAGARLSPVGSINAGDFCQPHT